MMKRFAMACVSFMIVCSAPLAALAEDQDVGPAKAERRFEGKITKIITGKKAIFVVGPNKARKDFFLMVSTHLESGGKPVDFAKLHRGMRVRVTYTLENKRLSPLTIDVLDRVP